jgi:hypothetical protein
MIRQYWGTLDTCWWLEPASSLCRLNSNGLPYSRDHEFLLRCPNECCEGRMSTMSSTTFIWACMAHHLLGKGVNDRTLNSDTNSAGLVVSCSSNKLSTTGTRVRACCRKLALQQFTHIDIGRYRAILEMLVLLSPLLCWAAAPSSFDRTAGKS